jgi:cytochrome c-type biogenesis protein CcmH
MATAPSAAPISAKRLGAAGGVVTAEAKAEFERAIALNADEPKASYFLGLAAEQDGRRRGRVDLARDAGKGAPDAPWRPLVQAALARVGGGPAAPALSDDAMAAAKDMTRPIAAR